MLHQVEHICEGIYVTISERYICAKTKRVVSYFMKLCSAGENAFRFVWLVYFLELEIV